MELVSHSAEKMAADEGSYGKVGEKHEGLVFGNLKLLFTIFNLRRKGKATRL